MSEQMTYIEKESVKKMILRLGGATKSEMIAFLGFIPSIDLVRCAECIHKRLYDGETKYYYCALEDRPNRQWSVDDWNFCYWGERGESDE